MLADAAGRGDVADVVHDEGEYPPQPVRITDGVALYHVAQKDAVQERGEVGKCRVVARQPVDRREPHDPQAPCKQDRVHGRRKIAPGALAATSPTDQGRSNYLWFGNSFRKGNKLFAMAILKWTLEPE